MTVQQTASGSNGFLKLVTNYEEKTVLDSKGNEKDIKKPIPIDEIFNQIQLVTGGWPKMTGQQMFVTINDDLEPIRNKEHLFAWLHSQSVIAWHAGRSDNFVTESQIYEYLQMHAERYAYATSYPHLPRLKNTYYIKKYVPEKTGKLDELLAFFNPDTKHDRQLLKAMFITPFWGGPSGRRPAFVLTAREDDDKGGRGVGKTMITDVLSRITGGFVDLSIGEKFDQIKTRMIHARNIRLVRFDNVKQERGKENSTAEIEGLITSSIVSGKELFKGEGQVPNIWTYIFTFNQAELTEDMAQRAVLIKLARPEYTKNWEEIVDNFVEQYKDEVIQDALYVLSQWEEEMPKYNRFTAWARGVLSKVADEAVLDYIAEEQAKHNAEKKFSLDIEEMFETKIASVYDLQDSNWLYENSSVFVETGVIIRWYNDEISKFAGKKAVTQNLKKINAPWLHYGRVNNRSGFLVRLGRNARQAPKVGSRIYLDRGDDICLSREMYTVYDR